MITPLSFPLANGSAVQNFNKRLSVLAVVISTWSWLPPTLPGAEADPLSERSSRFLAVLQALHQGFAMGLVRQSRHRIAGSRRSAAMPSCWLSSSIQVMNHSSSDGAVSSVPPSSRDRACEASDLWRPASTRAAPRAGPSAAGLLDRLAGGWHGAARQRCAAEPRWFCGG